MSLRGFLVLSETKGALATKQSQFNALKGRLHPDQAVRFIILKNYNFLYINNYRFGRFLNEIAYFYNCLYINNYKTVLSKPDSL